MSKTLIAAVVLAGIAAASPQAVSQVFQTEVTELSASDGDQNDEGGGSVAISGNTAVMGARYDDDAGSKSGSAYVYQDSGSGWVQQAKLTASDAALDTAFGWSVAIDGETIVVGTPVDDQVGINAGAAYVFVRNGTSWTQQAKLTANDALPQASFGITVSISGETILVGAGTDNAFGSFSGGAYVYVRSGTTWSLQTRLIGLDQQALSRFGESVSLDGDTALVGARTHNSWFGAAYVFVRSGTTWTQQQKLLASDGAAGDDFGVAVSLSGDTALVGAGTDDDAGDASGAAYVYVRNGGAWTEQTKLISSDAAAGDGLGQGVVISGDTAIVGSASDDDAGVFSGSAYVFTRSGTSWSEQVKLVASDAAAVDFFGWSLSLSGGTAVVGARFGDGIGGVDTGSVYVFELGDPAGFFDLGASGAPGLTGEPLLAGTGDLTPGSGTGFTLDLSNAKPSANSFLFVAFGAGGTLPFKGGTYYAFPLLLQLGIPIDGLGGWSVPASMPISTPSEASFVFQVWLADPAAAQGAAGSNGLQAVVP